METESIALKKGLSLPARLVILVALLAVAVLAPIVGAHAQIVTGPIVNATLFLAVLYLGTSEAIFVALVPSLVALSTGLLPAVLAPVIPFIMICNVLLVMTFSVLRKKSYWAGAVTASVVKFAVLFACTGIVSKLILKSELVSKAAQMMGLAQLLTALAGAVIAYGVYFGIKNVKAAK